MTDQLRQAAQQALEALEAITRSVQSDHQAEIAEDAITALRTALEQQAEPVQELITHITWDERGVRTVNGIPDDAPQRPWVGLTVEERNACLVSADPCEALADPEAKQLMEDIEEKLRSKNT